MNNIQHIVIMLIEELPTDNEGYVSIAKIASGVKADLSNQYPVGKTFVWWGFR